MKELTKEESRLLLTIQGHSPLGYKYKRYENENISNKLHYIYQTLKNITTISHDMIRLVSKLDIKSERLNMILLSVNYGCNSRHREVKEVLFTELYAMLQILDIKDINLNYELMEKEELPIEEELEGLTIEEGLGYVMLYYCGSEKRSKGAKILFNKFIKGKKKLSFDECEFIDDFFSSVSGGMDLDLLKDVFLDFPNKVKMTDDNGIVEGIKYSCFRKSGECSSWGKQFIKVVYEYEYAGNGLIDFYYTEYTSGDDYTQGFYRSGMKEGDVLELINDFIEPYLREACATGMKDSKNFVKFYKNAGIKDEEIDFN